MTATTVKGEQITKIETNPISIIDRRLDSNGKVVNKDSIEVATTSIDEVGDIILLCKIPSNCIIDGIYLKNDDLDSNGTPTLAADIGLYYSGKQNKIGGVIKDSGDVIDADCFATADISLQAAKTTWTEVTNEVLDIANYDKEAWEVGGLASDPGGIFYLGLTLTAVSATPVAGTIVAKIEYT